MGRVLKAAIIFKGIMIEWVTIKGFEESFDDIDDMWSESRHQVFRKIQDHGHSAMLHFYHPTMHELALKSYMVRHCGGYWSMIRHLLNSFYHISGRLGCTVTRIYSPNHANDAAIICSMHIRRHGEIYGHWNRCTKYANHHIKRNRTAHNHPVVHSRQFCLS